jgi:hypothetical protein
MDEVTLRTTVRKTLEKQESRRPCATCTAAVEDALVKAILEVSDAMRQHDRLAAARHSE